MTDQLTTRQRASAILSAAKMRALEDAGITVVEAQHLKDLEFQVKYMEQQCQNWSDIAAKGMEVLGLTKGDAK